VPPIQKPSVATARAMTIGTNNVDDLGLASGVVDQGRPLRQGCGEQEVLGGAEIR
jgi:hypothetical protein